MLCTVKQRRETWLTIGMKLCGKTQFNEAITCYGLDKRKEIKFIMDEVDRVRAKCTWDKCLGSVSMQAENLKDAEKSHADTLNLKQGEIDRLSTGNLSLFALNAEPSGHIAMISGELFAEP
jgi:hypothetical protein